MIVWLNGAFGAGKTTAAYELQRRLPDAFVYDPENVGYFLRRNLPAECNREDFQDIALWRSLNRQILEELYETYSGTILVPMTLVNPAYYDEIIQTLLDRGVVVKHMILYAGRETILKRLRRRSLGRLRREAFAVEAIERCLAYFDCCTEGTKIISDDLTVEQVVERIAAESGLRLLPDASGKLGKACARLKTVINNIR